MRSCQWPRGCDLPRSLVLGEGYQDDLCIYHWKLVRGLIGADLRNFRRPGIKGSQVLSDEQLELAEALKALGASEDVIRSALSKPA